MRRRLDLLLPALVLLGFVVTAVAVTLLLNGAQERGVDALEQSVTAEVEAVARSQNQRFLNTFSGTAGLSNPEDPFALIEGSEADLVELTDLLDLFGASIRAGFYLLDAEGTITQGVLFTEDFIGTTFEWPGAEELVTSPSFAQGTGGVLPVSKGFTTEEPVLAFVIPILDPATGSLRGSFVFESVVAADSDLNKEIGQLQRGETGRYYFLDDGGSVVASNDSAAIAQVLDDERFLEESVGLHRFDRELVVLADVPAAGWRVAFRQDTDEFEEALVGPLESVGRLLILVLLSGGFLFTVLLVRRLRAARAEQQRLREQNEAQQEFISIVSHELRTPVAGVLGFLETSLDHWDAMADGERKTAISRAASNARRLQALTRDVLDTQTIEGGRGIDAFLRLDLVAEVRVAVTAAFELVDSDRPVELDLPDEPVWIDADADRLQQVLANLIDNARKNSPPADPIEIVVRRVGSTAEVVVSDHGPGIAGDALERIFDKFVRGRGDTVSGTGLGLFISRQIIDAHGGRIWAESEPGQGATFRFVLPQSRTPESGPAPATTVS